MQLAYFLLFLFAGVCFLLATVGRSFGTETRKIDLLALGLLLWVAVEFLRALQKL